MSVTGALSMAGVSGQVLQKPEVEVCVQVVYGERSRCPIDELAATRGWAEGEIELPCACNKRG